MKRTLFSIAISLFTLSNYAQAQAIVTTIVDSSAYGFTDDLIFDASGNLYCADYSGDAIFKRTPSGTITTFASGFNTPNGLAFDSFGNLFMCDNIGNAIYKMDSNGAMLDTFQISAPSGIIKDVASDTLIYTTYGAQSTIMKLAPDGSSHAFHSGAPLNGPVGLEYVQGILYTANFNNREIYRVENDTLVFIAQLPGSGSLGFLANVEDQLMATAFNGHEIYTIDPVSEDVSLYSGSVVGDLDGPVGSALFTTPNGIVANAAADTIYISEYSTKSLRMITGFTVSLNELISGFNAEIYPNPSSDWIHITIEESALPYSFSLIDANGRIVLENDNVTESSFKMDVKSLNEGTYILNIQSKNIGTTVKRIIKLD